jgi:glyoxylase-like metal-dependent hydrolase (beta-lactamase superfamily II)
MRTIRLLATAPVLAWAITASAPAEAETLPSGLSVDPGPVNGVVLERDGGTLVVYGAPSGRVSSADTVLFTHHRRDVVYAGRELVERGATAVVPAAEIEHFTGVEAFWQGFRESRFHDYGQQTTKVLATPLPVGREVKGGDEIPWADLTFRVLDSPGYTRGAVSYVAEIDGTTVAFTGDLIHGDGRLLDLYSLQDFPRDGKGAGYHGFGARLVDLLASLERLAAEEPDLLVPARGPVIREPRAAIERLTARSRAVYTNVLATDALRWHFGDENLMARARSVLGPAAHIDSMETAELRELPEWVIPIENARVIRAADGSGFALDCGYGKILDEMKGLVASGTLTSLDHVWVTHYHDDHTGAVPDLVEAFGSTVYAVHELVDVYENPRAYRLPAATARAIPVTARLQSGATWRWKEFELTAWFFPGQTLHHQALLVTHDSGESLLFVGDSFSPSGLDDYCPQNRLFLHEGMGYLRCLDLLRSLPPGTWLVNQHVPPAFRFSPVQLDRMEGSLRERMELVRELSPWDDPNYALDEGWARIRPYEAAVEPGATLRGSVVVTNHSPEARAFRARLQLPSGWSRLGPEWGAVRVPPRQEGVVPFEVRVPADASPGLRVLAADIDSGEWALRHWTEMLVEVAPE